MTVEIFEEIDKEKIERFVARNEGVQDALDKFTFKITSTAASLLKEHRSSGDSHVYSDRSDIDRYVILSDQDDQDSEGVATITPGGAAMAIEYGRQGYIDPITGQRVGAMEGLYILHRAAGLSGKGAKIKPDLKAIARRERRKKKIH